MGPLYSTKVCQNFIQDYAVGTGYRGWVHCGKQNYVRIIQDYAVETGHRGWLCKTISKLYKIMCRDRHCRNYIRITGIQDYAVGTGYRGWSRCGKQNYVRIIKIML